MNQISLLRPLRFCMWGIGIWVTIASAQIKASPQTESQITLQGAIKRTLNHHPDLHAFKFRQTAIKGEIKTASLKPALNVGITIENLLGTGQVAGIKEAELTLSLSSVIEFGNKLNARGTVIKVKSTVVEMQQQLRSLDLLAEVTRRYVDVLAQQALLDVHKEAETLARYTYQSLTKRVNAGASPVLEQKRASSALAKARLDVITAEQSLQAMIKSLAIMWGEQSPTFTQVQGDLYVLPESPSLSELFTQLLDSPNVHVYAQQVRLQQAQTRLVSTSNQADLNWSAGLRRFNTGDETAFVIGLSMPLFSGERNLGEYQQQQAIIGQLEQQQKSAILALYDQLNRALLARNNALLTVQTLQSAIIPPLEDAFNSVEQAYLDGRYSYVEWLSTAQELLNAKQRLIQSAKQAHQRGADIESLTGQPLINQTSASLLRNK